MQTSETTPYSLSPQTILDLVEELTIGQRSADTLEQLAACLHAKLFPQLGPFFFEIYFPQSAGTTYRAVSSNNTTVKIPHHVPIDIPVNDPLVVEIRTSGHPLEIPPLTAAQTGFLQSTDNFSHLLAPITNGKDLLGILYLGCSNPCSFSSLYLRAIETLTAIIGSRLKSLGTILQLKESMRALEYSERLRTALYEISEQAHHAKDISNLYANLHQIVGSLIPATNFFVALVEHEKDGQYISFPYYADINDQFQGRKRKFDPERPTLTGYLLKTRQPLLLTPKNYHTICRENNIHSNGTPPNSWLGVPFSFEDLAGVVAVQSYDDVIYREQDQELLAFVARHLGDALQQKNAVQALETAKNKAEKAEKNKSTFLANMSHEIRTPMNGIIGLTDLLLKSDITGHQRTYMELIYSSANRLLKLINDILDFSKIEAGKLELDISSFGLRRTIADALEILAINAAKKNIAMKVDCPETVPDLLMGDADKLHQILINLVGNAIKFTNQGSVTLVVQAADKPRAEDQPIELRFQVKDTGIGIPEEEIANVFKSFRQLGTTRDSNHRGTGLGLVIAAELVEMMGGKICVESNPGVGTTFYFSALFPLAPPDEENLLLFSERSSSTHDRISGEPALHILLVEDEYINRTLAINVLEREGWSVSIAENGLEALNILETETFDLILMDVQMPEMNGYETTRAIRRQELETARHMPIIAMTAYAVKGDREKCLAAGMDGYISKPIRPDRLRDEIETILQHHRTRSNSQAR